MGYICTRCGGTKVACEAIVNPNTREIIDYLDESFAHAICGDKDSGILIGITPIYKIRLWSEEVKVVNDKMTNMKTRTYEGVQHGDWVRCVLCGAQMLLPCGADKCPECSSKDTLMWVDENRQEMDAKHLDCLVPIRKLELQEYLSPEILKMEHI